MTGLTVVYDACVLYPAPLRDLLMQIALSSLVRARWSAMIHDEWMRSVLRDRPDLTAQRLDRTRMLMDQHVLDAVVTGFESIIENLELPDVDDRHVLAAAIHCGADKIVTYNLKDFPAEILSQHGIVTAHPDDFLVGLLEADSKTLLAAVKQHRGRLRNPPKSADDYLLCLGQQRLTQTVAKLRQSIESI